MPGIANDSVAQLNARIYRFDQRYVQHWMQWTNNSTPQIFRLTMNRWQAVRGGRILVDDAVLVPLLSRAAREIAQLYRFRLGNPSTMNHSEIAALRSLWAIFEDVCCASPKPLRRKPPANGGKAGAVGISKAVLLVSQGQIGPAFDSEVKRKLGITRVASANEWIQAIETASQDVQRFEQRHGVDLQTATRLTLQPGRIYDMALGPS